MLFNKFFKNLLITILMLTILVIWSIGLGCIFRFLGDNVYICLSVAFGYFALTVAGYLTLIDSKKEL